MVPPAVDSISKLFYNPLCFIIRFFIRHAGVRISACLIPIAIFLTAVNLVAFYLYDKLTLLMEASERKIRLEEQLEYQTAFYRSLEEAQDNIRRIRHDMKNHPETLNSLLRQGRTADAGDYISRITGAIDGAETVITTNNPPIDTVLNIKIHTADKNNISLSHQITIPGGLPISYEQSAAILGNLLDNAIEAQMFLDEASRSIDLRMIYDGERLVIVLKNSFNREKTDLETMRTNKKNNGKHGIGLLNIRKTVEAMGGTFQIGAVDGLVRADVLLYLKESSVLEQA